MASRWWPPDEPLAGRLQSLKAGDDLLPMLRAAAEGWVARASKPADKRAATQLALLHQRLRETEAKLTFGWPGGRRGPDCHHGPRALDNRRLEDWIGSRLLCWPSGIPSGRKVAWVSSRLGRAIEERPDWFAVLRTAAAKLDPEQDLLLTAPCTTTDRFLERAALLFELRLLRVHLDETRSLTDWLVRLRRHLWRHCLETQTRAGDDMRTRQGADAPRSPESVVALSPPVGMTGAVVDLLQRPLADRVLVAMADQLVALQLRPHGNLHELLKRRLSDASWPAGSVWLALGEQLVPSEVADELQSLGAVGWYLWPKEQAVSHVLETTPCATAAISVALERKVSESAELLSEMLWPEGSYLVHWTRRRVGPWPEESAADFVDELLLSHGETSRSAFAALVRIVRQRRLIASAAGIRGGCRIVSFSATPLSELPRRRTFRRHQGRWDFEQFGLCVRRDWLESQGARHVIYGDESEWPALSSIDQPFWQLRQTRSRRGAATIDWSMEAEWRVPENVDLSQAPRDAVLLFAPSEAEATQLAAISPWPVVVLGKNVAAP